MARKIKNPQPKLDLETEALTALEVARAMEPGPARTEAMKRAGILRNAADLRGFLFATREDRRKPDFCSGPSRREK
jgi:hypothetical protein